MKMRSGQAVVGGKDKWVKLEVYEKKMRGLKLGGMNRSIN